VNPEVSDGVLHQQWLQWITSHSYERLLVACYILETFEGLLLIRPMPDLDPTAAEVGFDLYVPVNHEIWDARTPSQWQSLITSAGDLESCVNKDVLRALDDIAHGVQLTRMDAFQSSLLVAVRASSIQAQVQVISPYSTYMHAAFAPETISLYENSLSVNPYVRLMHEAVNLSTCTPFKALLATSGESWLLSQKLSTEARTAKDAFELLKADLRLWASALHLPLAPLYTGAGKAALATPLAFTLGGAPARRALRHALRIVALALDASPDVPAFGPEMALHYAALVLWACAYGALHGAGPPAPLQLSTGGPDPAAHKLSVSSAASSSVASAQDPDAEPLAPEAAEAAGRHFVDLANRHVAESELSGVAVPPCEALESWKMGVGAILRWTAWIEGGAMSGAGGVGELMNGVVGVLEKLGKKGWVEGWF